MIWVAHHIKGFGLRKRLGGPAPAVLGGLAAVTVGLAGRRGYLREISTLGELPPAKLAVA